MPPEIQRRFSAGEARQQHVEDHELMDSDPNDFLQWSIRQTSKRNRATSPPVTDHSHDSDLDLMLTFAAMHTTSFAITYLRTPDLAASNKTRVYRCAAGGN